MRFMHLILITLLLSTGVAFADTTAPAAPEYPATRTSHFEETYCRFYEPDTAIVECGDLIVPEDRSDPNSPMIKVHVAIFRSRNPMAEEDPIVYLEGGPGGSALESIAWSYEVLVEPFIGDRDFIVFDQRGTGYSEPRLTCPELDEIGMDIVNQYLMPVEVVESSLGAVAACQQRLVNEGVNLAAYNSAASAADLNDLRLALGYKEWNLFGISYGTRLALTAMRDYPEGIRSVVLDSTYPPQASLYAEVPANVNRALQTLFDNCTLDTYCNGAYPDLRNVFDKLVAQLNAEPVSVQIEDVWMGNQEVLVTGDSLIGIMFNALYSERLIPSLPRLLYDARAGDYDMIAQIHFALTLSSLTSPGMYYSVQCHEEVPFNTPEEMMMAINSHPEMRDFFNSSYYMGKAMMSVCDFWGAGQGNAIENNPVVSDIPTLVMAGEFDPITPPEWGRATSEYLTNSFYYEFPNLGHGVSLSSACTLDVMRGFLSDPSDEPDVSCSSAIGMEYVVIGAPVTMTDFEDSEHDIQGIVPESWILYDEGLYALSPLPGDAELTVDYYDTYDLDYFLEYHPLFDEFQPYSSISLVDEVTYNDLDWEVYRFDNGAEFYDVALSRISGGGAYVIQLASPASERDWLYSMVFLPVLENFALLD